MTGWRIGYAYAEPEIIEKIKSVHIYFSVCPPTPSIVAATIAMADPRGKIAMEGFKKNLWKVVPPFVIDSIGYRNYLRIIHLMERITLFQNTWDLICLPWILRNYL